MFLGSSIRTAHVWPKIAFPYWKLGWSALCSFYFVLGVHLPTSVETSSMQCNFFSLVAQVTNMYYYLERDIKLIFCLFMHVKALCFSEQKFTLLIHCAPHQAGTTRCIHSLQQQLSCIHMCVCVCIGGYQHQQAVVYVKLQPGQDDEG